MNVLVTGGAGFIGSHVVDHLLAHGHSVKVLDALISQVHGNECSRPPHLDPRAELIVGRVEDRAVMAKALKGIDSVVHLAAAVGVGQSMYQIIEYCETNVMGTANLLQALVERKQKLHSLVVASSMSVYGEGLYQSSNGLQVSPGVRPEAQLVAKGWELIDGRGGVLVPVPTHERKTLEPSSVYAISKRDEEEMCLTVGGAYGIPATALRFFNAYGARQALANPYTGVAAIFCARLLNDRQPLIFEDGHQKRDFVHVGDVARAILSAAEKPVPGEAINIGSGAAITVLEVAALLAETLNKRIPPKVLGQFRKGDIRHCFADITKARDLLGWRPAKSFQTGVKELIEWVRLQQEARDDVDSAWQALHTRGLLS